MAKSDKDWEAEGDAHTLVNAEAIQADKARLGKAKAAAKRMLKEEQVKAQAMARVAKGKVKSTGGGTTGKKGRK